MRKFHTDRCWYKGIRIDEAFHVERHIEGFVFTAGPAEKNPKQQNERIYVHRCDIFFYSKRKCAFQIAYHIYVHAWRLPQSDELGSYGVYAMYLS